MIIINFKKYKKGRDVLKLARKIQKYKRNAIVTLLSKDISEVSKKTKLKVFSQFVEAGDVKNVKKLGAKGSLLNHFDHRVSMKTIRNVSKEAGKEKFKLIIIVKNLKHLGEINKLNPWAIAFEDPKLIGTGKSITEYRANDLKKFVSLFRKTKIIPICGAGVSSKKDVIASKKIGCKGVIISSAIAKGSFEKAEKLLKEIR